MDKIKVKVRPDGMNVKIQYEGEELSIRELVDRLKMYKALYRFWQNEAEKATKVVGKTKSVKCIETQKIYESAKQAERETGICHSHISKCCSGKSKTAGGVRWEYA